MLRSETEMALDRVTEQCKRAADHYRIVARTAGDPALVELFRALALRREELLHLLEDEIRKMGILPSETDPDREALDHLATRIQSVISRDERYTLLERTLVYEDELQQSVHSALRRDLPPPIGNLLRRLEEESRTTSKRLELEEGGAS